MKKYELLEKAMRDYPKDRRFISVCHKEEINSNGVFYISESINEKPSVYSIVERIGRAVFYNDKWAEIITDKPDFITVSKDSQYPVEVYNDRIRIKCNGSENHSDNIIIRESELKEIYDAYYSLRD